MGQGCFDLNSANIECMIYFRLIFYMYVERENSQWQRISFNRFKLGAQLLNKYIYIQVHVIISCKFKHLVEFYHVAVHVLAFCFSSCGSDAHWGIHPPSSEWGEELWSPVKQALLGACSHGYSRVYWNTRRFPHHCESIFYIL